MVLCGAAARGTTLGASCLAVFSVPPPPPLCLPPLPVSLSPPLPVGLPDGLPSSSSCGRFFLRATGEVFVWSPLRSPGGTGERTMECLPRMPLAPLIIGDASESSSSIVSYCGFIFFLLFG